MIVKIRKQKILLSVIGIHLLLILLLVIPLTPSKKKAKKTKLMVQHVALNQGQINTPVKKHSPSPKSTPSSTQASTMASTMAKTKPTPSKPTATPSEKTVKTPAPTSKTPSKEQEEGLKEVMAALMACDMPSPIPSKESKQEIQLQSTSLSFDLFSYEESLISFLQEKLILPEYGNVQILVVLDKKGALCSCNVLHSESKKNEAYLYEKLPLLTFPHFTKELSGEIQKSFTLNFSNLTP
jgi:outer membrane biosynthesis protein TonB